MITKEKTYGYIVLTKNYLGKDTYCTQPNSTITNRKLVELSSGEMNKIQYLFEDEKTGKKVVIPPQTKEMYAIYQEIPSDIRENIIKSNKILAEQGKPYVNEIHKCYIPKNSLTDNLQISEIVGKPYPMLLTTNVFIYKKKLL